METSHRFLRIPVCSICRDQLYDFSWASGVQALVALLGGLSLAYLALEEVLLFVVLVVVKHVLPPPWERKRAQ